MQKIYHKRNGLLEVEFFKDKECTKAFDFTDAKDLYIELKDGDCTPIFTLHTLGSFNIFTPYIPLCVSNEFKHGLINTYIKTLDDITPNLSKYIPENNAVLFLNDNDFQDYNKYFLGSKFSLIQYPILDKCNLRKSLNFTIFLHYGTQTELQKVNEVAKELKEKYGTKKVNVFVLHCFTNIRVDIFRNIYTYSECLLYKNVKDDYTKEKELYYINKIITTNSTGLLKLQNNERLQVIDCFDIFNDSIGLTTDETIIKSTNNIGGILQKLADR